MRWSQFEESWSYRSPKDKFGAACQGNPEGNTNATFVLSAFMFVIIRQPLKQNFGTHEQKYCKQNTGHIIHSFIHLDWLIDSIHSSYIFIPPASTRLTQHCLFSFTNCASVFNLKEQHSAVTHSHLHQFNSDSLDSFIIRTRQEAKKAKRTRNNQRAIATDITQIDIDTIVTVLRFLIMP